MEGAIKRKTYEDTGNILRMTIHDLVIEDMKETDLEEVMAIEKASFSEPWNKGMFLQELESPFSYAWVVRDKGHVVGYICFWLIFDEAHILNLAVHPRYRNQGIGSLLLAKAINFWERIGIRGAFLEVRVSNVPAQKLYTKFGFRIVGRRPDYYRNPREDAFVMYLDI